MGCGAVLASLSMNYGNINKYINKVVCLSPSVYPSMSSRNKLMAPLIKLPILKLMGIKAIPNFPRYVTFYSTMLATY